MHPKNESSLGNTSSKSPRSSFKALIKENYLAVDIDNDNYNTDAKLSYQTIIDKNCFD